MGCAAKKSGGRPGLDILSNGVVKLLLGGVLMEYSRINVRVGKKTVQSLNKICEQYGMSKSSLVAYVLGQFVSNHERFMAGLPEKLQDALVETLRAERG